MAPLVNNFVAAIGRNQDKIAPNFQLGLAALLGMVLSCLGVMANAYRSKAIEVKKVNKVEANATNLVSIDHNGSTLDTSQEYIPQNFLIPNSSYQNTYVLSQ